MVKYRKLPFLIKKGSNYYFRGSIPQKYWIVAKCKEICYTLKTDSKELAIRRWHYAIYWFQRFLNTFEEVCMRFNKEGQLCFTRDEVERILLYGLKGKQFQLEEKADEIAEGSFKEEDIQFYSPEDAKDAETSIGGHHEKT